MTPRDPETGVPRSDDPYGFGQTLNADGYIAFKRQSTFALGLDLGQQIDPTAIAIVERIVEAKRPREIGSDLLERAAPPRYECRWLMRMPLQTSYPDVVSFVGNRLSLPPLRQNCRLVIDATGVGRPIVDLFARAGLRPIGVTITAGDSEHRDPDGSQNYRVAKIVLVSRLQALLHSGALAIARSLPEQPALVSELQNFRASISDLGNASFGARQGAHDDLVLALAIALWYLAGPQSGTGRMRVLPLEL